MMDIIGCYRNRREFVCMNMNQWKHKKQICVLLVAVLLIGLLPAVSFKTQAATKGLSMAEMMAKFPHGKYWNGGDYYGNTWTETPCTHHGSCNAYDGRCGCNSFMGMSIQCMGFAEKLGYDATTYNPRVNANGWYKYTSVSALNNLKPGDIVRMDSASGYGHSIYVTGVDGETVTFADCNSYNRSCNIRWGATTTKSYLRSVFQWVQSAPFALDAGYLVGCEMYVSNGTVKITNDTVLRTLPCTQEKEAESVEVYNQPQGTRVTVTALYRNPDGAYWYKTSYNGQDCYLFAGDTDDFQGVDNEITISGVRAPANTKKGSSFSIKGKVQSEPLSLSRVSVYIYKGTDISATPYMTSQTGTISAQSYEIYGSTVDNNLKFGQVAVGDYTYLIQATTTNYSADENVLASVETTKRLHQNTFSVTSTLPCTHSYSSQVISEPMCSDDGITLYTCTKCQFTYQEYAFGEEGHITGSWKTVTEPGCTEPGFEERYCETCKKTYTRELPAVGHSYESVVTPPTETEQGYTTHTCTACGDSYVDSYTAPKTPETLYRLFVMLYEASNNVVAESLKASDSSGSLGGAEMSYEDDSFITDCTFQFCVTGETEDYAVFMMKDAHGRYVYMTDGSEQFFVSSRLPEDGYLWKAEKADQEGGFYITNTATGKVIGYDAQAEVFGAYADKAKGSVLNLFLIEILSGDVNEDGIVDNMDVEYLLWHTLFPEDYPLNVMVDYNLDGAVDNLDVEYLLWHTLFPEDYPMA